jgi:hypothetical protein
MPVMAHHHVIPSSFISDVFPHPDFFILSCSPDPAYGRRGRCHKIVYRHNVTSGNWVLIVDGRFEASGYEPITARRFSVSFKLGNNNCYIEAVMESLIYSHNFFVDNQIQIPFSRLAQSPFTESIPTHISIPSFHLQTDPLTRKDIVYYQLQVQTGSGEVVKLSHRYSEFDLLDKCLKSQMDGHLRSSLPNLPGKVFNPFVNQLSQDFLESRRLSLQQYLVTLLGNSKVSSLALCLSR